MLESEPRQDARSARTCREKLLIAKELRINDDIRAPQVRLIRDSEQLGVMSIEDAQRIADDAALDLVEVAATADPPVCRILDYGKFKYEQAKRERESRRGSRSVELRELRLGSVKIDGHDLNFKAKTARKLLGGGDKVKVSVRFRAREITHPEVGRDLLDRFTGMLEDVATIDRPPAMEGRQMSIVLEPRKGEPKTDDAESSDEAVADAGTTPETQPVTGSS
jgi:translation initiation factor IF-3